ncbi:MAG TPA: hypothetical protein VE439_06065 [Anaerolineae bacterium]|jgi:type II secretory pathway component PulF|nr:hypothetical protein [Anaerolineae bacterium]
MWLAEVIGIAEPERHDDEKEREVEREERGSLVIYTAIKYAAIVIIVIVILYFLAVFVIPLFR